MRGTPETFLAFAPRGAGLLCALFYLVEAQDVFGWFIGATDSQHRAAFFELEKFYSPAPGGFLATDGNDLQGGWRFDYSKRKPGLDTGLSVPQDWIPELDRLQDVFDQEWLFFPEDPSAAREVEAYRDMELPFGEVAIKPQALGKLQKGAAVWRYFSPHFDGNVLDYLMPRWPLDYRDR